jgi:NADPH2:quinone reductase
MPAATIVPLDGPDGLRITNCPEPIRELEQVLIGVNTVGIVYPDLLLSKGRYQVRDELPFVLGSRVAVTVAAAPSDSPFNIGDRVCATTLKGVLAERVAIDANRVMLAPSRLSWEEAATCTARPGMR